ncbi:MAG: exodeoxyribonuclease V subunit gamma [Actinomycetes bacterium]
MNHSLHVHASPDLMALARSFAVTATSVADPFARPLVLVPGAGTQRWLSQQVARASDDHGEGISAGIDVRHLSGLESALTAQLGGEGVDDPWEPATLVWAVLSAAASADPALAPLATHLAANDQRYANALRIARLIRRYADHRPALLARWSTEPDAAASALGFDGWQVRLWQHLHQKVPAPDPLVRRAALAEALTQGRSSLPWPSVHVFAPRRSTPVQRDLVRALACRVPVHVWLATAGPADTPTALAAALGRAGRAEQQEWLALAGDVVVHPGAPPARSGLGRLQAGVHAGAPLFAVADGSVSIHASHELGRQVEVLREVLTGLFADDSTLEPRHVVIGCPDPTALAPHLAAAFSEHAGASPGWSHPATRLRVQVADAGAAEANQLFSLLRELLTLGTSRATASQLMALAAHPFVARRFGFGHDDLERLEELIAAAAIRWGINPAHRAWFGLGDVRQNTWQLGVQRLVLGEAFSDDHLTHVGVVSTVDDVTSTDTWLIGALAELVSRISRLVRAFDAEGTATTWAGRLRDAVESLADVPFDQGWQLSQVWGVLQAIEERGGGSAAALRASDALALLTDAFADRGVRPAFGNGSLVVCSLDALARVPHRVVCLVGLDERGFPRRGLGDGDDLLARDPRAGDPDPGADDRQAVLDAVLAAGERLVVVYQGQSSLTVEPHYPPAGVQELIEACGQACVRQESLQPFAPVNFLGEGRSFDVDALGAARAVVASSRPAPSRWEVGYLHRTTPLTELGVERLCALVAHPGKFLLRERADLTVGDDDPLDERIPLELGHLAGWKIGEAMLASLRAGHSPESVVTAQWLSGSMPPRQLGASAITAIADKAQSVHRAFLSVAEGTPQVDVVDLEVAGLRLTGRLVTRGGLLIESHYGSVSARQLGETWVRLLALTVALGRRTDAVLVGGRGSERLVAPPVDLAHAFLADLVDLARHATERVLPLSPRVGQFWANERARGRDPKANSAQLRRLWEWDRDAVWKLWYAGERTPWSIPREPGDPWGQPEEDSQTGALAVRVWDPIGRAQG